MLKSIFGAGSENKGKRLLVTGMYGLLNSAGGRKTNGIGILGMMSSVSGDGMVKGECVRGKASRRWLWGLVWWSTAESKGWKEEFGDFLGYVNGECMARRGDTWPITCGKLGPTGWLISGQVVQGGTFAWRCGVAGLAGGRRLTCGVQGVGPDVYVWSDGCDLRSRFGTKSYFLKGVIRSVLKGEYMGLIRCVWEGSYKGAIRCVLWNSPGLLK
ncbi:hypothetical protein V6N13_027368 [Hibiscus sabdariffa]